MSGQQIGTVIGGAIGAYFGGPAGAQLGMAIGGMIGGAVDPTHINGPKIGDGQQQTATDGAPIAWVQGTAMIAGTICQVGPRRQIRHKDNGKGSGTVAVTYTAVQDFAILVCESSELRDSTINSILMVIQDGKLVYDVRPGSGMLADSYKWKANVDFLFGGEDQLPHPTLEAITGVGNTAAYRGSCIAVFKSFDVSQAGDRIPNFQFVVSSSSGFTELLTADTAFDALQGSSAPTPGNSYTYELNPTDTLMLEVFDGMRYRGWRYDTFTNKANWSNRIAVSKDGADSLYFTDFATTQEAAFAAAKAASPLYITGGSTYVAWLSDFPVSDNIGGASVRISRVHAGGSIPTLAGIIQRICLRGGLSAEDFDLGDMDSVAVMGYPIARQANAADCLLPLLQADFGFASEYDAKLRFKFYGEDAVVVVDRADLIEGNDSNNGAIVSNLRNQSTEFPRRIVGSYMDPAQNYTVVDVAAERRAVDVIAIGDQSFQIPVVMAADDAAKAVDKALKVAYATLEGTLEYSTPFAGSDVYLSLAAGEPLQFQGKRYVLDELILGNGNLKLDTRYDRQSAYTSNVQAILGNAPTPPVSPYSGPTTLIPMNLPAQRPQDSVGVYIAAAASYGSDSWRGCNVQVSYDGLATWQNALQIVMESTIGTIDSAATVDSEPVVVDTVKYDLENATSAQLSAGANAFSVTDSTGSTTQLGQFGAATETATAHQFELTSISRSLGGTAAAPMAADDKFALMDAAYFLPIDPSFAGRTLYFRGVGFGEIAEDAQIFSLVYTALIAAAGQQRIAEDGTPRIAEDGFNLRFTEN